MSSSEPQILYSVVDNSIAHIRLNRPETRNAQDTALLYALNDAFDRAAQDEAVKVIVLSAQGPHFSAGHDLKEGQSVAELCENMQQHRTVGTWDGFGDEGTAPLFTREKEIYLGFCERWRNIPKPTIAAVQGKCIAGGLMLAWPCDLIIAAADAQFQDNTLGMGVNGVEYFVHPWELGPRKAKEWLFTAGWLSAAKAEKLGMVNRVVPNEQLLEETLTLAKRIAGMPMFALKLAKETINAAQDAQGRELVLKLAFSSHHLAHSHNQLKFGYAVDPSGVIDKLKTGK